MACEVACVVDKKDVTSDGMGVDACEFFADGSRFGAPMCVEPEERGLFQALDDFGHPFAAIAVEEVDVGPGGEFAGGAGGEIVVALDGIDFAETVFLDVDHVAEICAALDQDVQIEFLGEVGEGALLDEVGNLGLGRTSEAPPGVFAHEGDALVGIEEGAIAERRSEFFSHWLVWVQERDRR